MSNDETNNSADSNEQISRVAEESKLKKILTLIFNLAIWGALAYWGYNKYQTYQIDQKHTQELIKVERQVIVDLEERAKAGDVQALIQLAKKMTDGYLAADGTLAKNIDKAIDYLARATELGSVEAKQTLGFLENQREKEAIARVAQENNENIIQFINGDWISRSHKVKISFDNSGDISYKPATFEEYDPDQYERAKNFRDNRRDEKYAGIKEEKGFFAALKERASDKTSDALGSSKDSAANAAIGMYMRSWKASGCVLSRGFVSDLDTSPMYAQIKESLSDSIFIRYVCSTNFSMFIPDSRNGSDSLMKFDCDNNGCANGGEVVQRLDASIKKTIPSKIEYVKPIVKVHQSEIPQNSLATIPNLQDDNSGPDMPNLPFVGTKDFNFYGGSGTGEKIQIAKNGNVTIRLMGGSETLVTYQGKFSNPMLGKDGFGWLLKDNKIYYIKDEIVVIGCNGEGIPCESELHNEW